MNHIICDFHPFTMNQNILVYMNGECVKTVSVTVDRVVDTVNGLCKQYGIHQIDLCGNQNYLERYKNLLNAKFDLDDETTINIIER